jgi:hypothetical protein
MITLAVERQQVLEAVKCSALATGIRLTAEASERLTLGGTRALSIHEYPTTGGITMVLEGGVYLNAPFDEWFCVDAVAELDVDHAGTGMVLRHSAGTVNVLDVLPLPGYLDRLDLRGRRVAEVAMSHADRVRLSPIVGCAYDCGYCDLADLEYVRRDADWLLSALEIAATDPGLPARHVLISGGSPRARHYDDFLQVCEDIIRGTDLPVDVMFSPMVDRSDMVPRLVDAGVAGFAINLEVFASGPAEVALGRKHRTVRDHLEPTIRQAVELLGSRGAVRSLIIVGLEPVEDTLRGVEHLAAMGCWPVLSPFRPAAGIALQHLPPPTEEVLAEVLRESRTIVARHGVALGPECGACQHNTLTFPWDVAA